MIFLRKIFLAAWWRIDHRKKDWNQRYKKEPFAVIQVRNDQVLNIDIGNREEGTGWLIDQK